MTESLLQGSPLWQLFSAFLWGVGSSFTPCVYPLIPVTLAIFGALSEVSRVRAFLLSLTYVLGMSLTYTILGMLSAKTGQIFGAALGKGWVILALTLLLFYLVLVTLDLARFPYIHTLQTKASHIGGKGWSGAFIMGLVSGIVAAPCVGPALVVILGFAAASQSFTWGAALLFTYSLGLGLLFLVLGTFSGLIKSIPRSGTWLMGVKYLLAVMLVMVTIFLAAPLLPEGLLSSLYNPGTAVLSLVLVLALFTALLAYKRHMASMRLMSTVLLALFLYSTAFSSSTSKEHGLTWHSSLEHALSKASQTSNYVMVDLYADWCGACKELDMYTFSDPEVQRALKKLVVSRIDFTRENEATLRISERYNVYGLPCILFLNGAGDELPESRITGFVDAQKFLDHLDKIGVLKS